MRLAVDATPVVPGRKGLGVVIEGFLAEIAARPGPVSWMAYADHAYAAEARRRWPSLDVCAVRARPSAVWEQVTLPWRARRDGADLLLTGRDRTSCEPSVPTVVYLFEVPDHRAHALLAADAPILAKVVAWYSLRRFRTIARTVSRFIVSSNATRQDLRDRYRVLPSRIDVVPPGVSDRFRGPADASARQVARNRFSGGRPYVLHFATGDPRENTQVALASFAQAIEMGRTDVALLVAGVRSDDIGFLKNQVGRLRIGPRTCFLERVDNDDLVSVYQGAEAYLDPTLYEGFGLQLVEAMACGVPVISSNVTSVPEVVGDAGLLFAPGDVDGLASALFQVLSDAESHARLAERGRARAQLFTWRSAASRIVGILEQVARQSRENRIAGDSRDAGD